MSAPTTNLEDFKTGHRVMMMAFVDGFGESHPQTEPLEVVSVEVIKCKYQPDYARVTACSDHEPPNRITYSAAAQFFIHLTA